MRRTIRLAGRLVALLTLGGVTAWLVVLHMPRTAALPAFAALLLGVGHRLPGRLRAAGWVVLFALAALSWRTPLRELGATLDRLSEVKETRGATGFADRDALGVYGLHLVMGLGGHAAGFPEAARETLHLCVRGPAVRTWHSDFAMGSPKVRAQVALLADHTRRARRDSIDLPVAHVAWSSYALGSDSLRVALALNSPLELTGTARRDGARWRLELVGRARVGYPRRALLVLGRVEGRPVILDEGLFWALQERGWLHPYVAEWRWSVETDDPRLRR